MKAKFLNPAFLFRLCREHVLRKSDRWLYHVDGVIHIGANSGQERNRYRKRGLEVLWVEAIPDVFAQLQTNIRGLSRQRGIQALLSDSDGETVDFHISNNEANSSSMLELNLHKQIWPEVHYSKTIQLKTSTFTSLVNQYSIDLSRYSGMVLDTQGSELRILQGAGPLLSHFDYIKTEAADFEAYKGCARLEEIQAYLAGHGFVEFSREIHNHPKLSKLGYGYFNVTYRRAS